MLSWDSIDSMSAGCLIGYHDFALGKAICIGLILVLEFDGEIEVLLCSVIDGDVLVQQLPTPLELCLQSGY